MAGPDALAVAAVLDGELSLLDPAVRGSAAALDRLLHKDFREYGASGAVWTRAALIEALVADPACSSALTEPSGRVAGPGVVLLTWRAVSPSRTSLRSSVWVLVDGVGWQLLFAQGTPVPA